MATPLPVNIQKGDKKKIVVDLKRLPADGELNEPFKKLKEAYDKGEKAKCSAFAKTYISKGSALNRKNKLDDRTLHSLLPLLEEKDLIQLEKEGITFGKDITGSTDIDAGFAPGPPMSTSPSRSGSRENNSRKGPSAQISNTKDSQGPGVYDVGEKDKGVEDSDAVKTIKLLLRREAELNEKDAEINKLKEEHAKEINDHVEACENLKSEKEKIQGKLNEEVHDKQSKLQSFEKALEENNSELGKLQEERKKLTQKLNAALEANKELEVENKKLSLHVEHVYKHNKKKQDEVKGQHENEMRKVHEKMNDIAKERDDLKTRIKDHVEECGNFKSEKEKMQGKLNEKMHDSQSKLQCFEKVLEEAYIENRKLEGESKTLTEKFNAALEANRELEVKNKHLNSHVEHMYKHNKKKQDEVKGQHENEMRNVYEKMNDIAKKRDDLKTRIKDHVEECGNLKSEKEKIQGKLEEEIKDKQSKLQWFEKTLEEAYIENRKFEGERKTLTEKFNAALEANKELEVKNKHLNSHVEHVYKHNKKKQDEVKGQHENEMRNVYEKMNDMAKERDDLKTRFSKLAGAKLTDQNADIADLSDPNRAMKVSEKFGQLYDDEWTDAFEELKKKKLPANDSIQLLLRILQECLAFCNNLKETQLDSLNNVLLHPAQDVSKFCSAPRTNVGGLKEKPRISSKNEKAVRDLRRQIGVSETCLDEIKQVFVIETRSWDKQGFDKKQLEVCTPYIQKCAEICWLMVMHDPPLYMKMDAKEGDKFDSNLYTVYSSSGDKISFLVWPPLYNTVGGGLITKGVAECIRTIKKK